MTHQICRDDIYANARVDAGVAEAIAGVNEEPFWVQAQTNLIRWVRTGHRLAGEPEPGIRSVAETARNTAKLETLITSALYRAGTGDKLAEARELERWLTHDWLRLDTALTYRLTHTLAEAGAQDITVTSRDGLHRTPVGERTGSWDRWDPTSLPEDPEQDGDQALRNLIRESLKTLGIGPGTAERIAGLPRDTIRSVLRGRSPTYRKLLKICDALYLRLTIERVNVEEAPPAIPAKPPMQATDSQTSRATRRQEAKNDVRATYYTSAPRGQIVNRLRQIPEDIVAEVIDEMVTEEAYDDSDELRSMAFQAGYKIW